MLVLSRRCDTEIYIGADIIVRVLEIHKRQVKLGIEAPNEFSVWRGELRQTTDRGESSVEQESCRSQQPCFAKPHGQHS
jgi:carbon storage regulator